MDIDSPLQRRETIVRIEPVNQLGAGEHPSRALKHRGKQSELDLCQRDALSFHGDFTFPW